MYINPFRCGVIATILAELGAIVIAAVIGAGKTKSGGNDQA